MEENQQPSNEVLKGSDLQAFFDGEFTPKQEEVVIPTLSEMFDEEVKPSVEEQIVPKQETPIPETNNTFYTSLVQDMLNDGDWVDGEVVLENGETVLVSELKEVTPTLFKELKEAQKKIKDEEFNSKYVSKEGLDDTTLKMIELKKAGGDLTSLIQAEVQYVHPLKGLDLTDDNVLASIVAQKYSSLGIDSDIIQMKIEKLIKDSQLDLEAQKIIQEVDNNFNAHVEAEKNKAIEQKQKQEENQKAFRKNITDAIKTFDISKDSIVKNLIDKSSKFDENGLTEVDKLYFDSKEIPELHAKVAWLLSDEKAFTEFFNSKAKLESKKEVTRTILQISPKGSSSAAVRKGDNPVEEFFNTK